MNEQTYPWYMVNKDGMCTLCADQADAKQEAKNAQEAWPHMGPHRAVRLVEVGDAGFTAADMATAAAQGFRDGQAAELAAMRAGGAPVAEMVPCHTPSGKRVAVISRFQHLPIGTKLYAHPQPATQDAERKPLGFFAMSDDFGFERHSTAQGARASANAILSELRDSAQSGEWPMESESVCWGAIFERAAETEVIEDCCDYVLQGAAIAAQGDSNE